MPEREQLISQITSRLEWAREKLKELERANNNNGNGDMSPSARAARRWGLVALIGSGWIALWLITRSTRHVVAAAGIAAAVGAVIATVMLMPDRPDGHQEGMSGRPDVTSPSTRPSPSSPTTIPPTTTTVPPAPPVPPDTSTSTALLGDGTPFTAAATPPTVTPGPDQPPTTTTPPPTAEPPPPDDHPPDEPTPDEANPSCLLQLDLKLAGLDLEVCV